MMLGSGGGGGGGDVRARILKPIRELKDNWDIDIAAELEGYLEELSEIEIGFEGVGEKLNFAEAALLIQGSTCVYSKKVEYLYQLVYSTLDVLIEKKRKKKGSVGEDGEDADAADWGEEPEFLALDDVVREGGNIDLREDAFGGDDPDAAAAGDYRKRRSTNLLHRQPVSLLSSRGGADEGENAFKISQCLVHGSGALLLEEKGAHLVEPGLVRSPGPAGAGLPFGSPAAVMGAGGEASAAAHAAAAHAAAAAAAGGGVDAAPLDFGDMNDDMPDLGDDDFGEGMMLHPPSPVRGGGYAPVDGAAEEEEDDDELGEYDDDEPDPWELYEPGAPCEVKVRPFKRGRTFTRPVAPDPSAISIFDPYHLNPVDVSRSSVAASLRVPYFAEFAPIFLHEKKRQRKAKAAPARGGGGGAAAPAGYGGGGGADDDDGPMLDLGGDDDDAPLLGLGGDDGGWGDDDDDDGRELGGDGDAGGLAALDGADDAELVRTYAEMCREHVANFRRGHEMYAVETQLTQRVDEWRSRIEPKLEEEESHVPFDIHQYGDQLLETLAETVDEGAVPPKEPIPFEEAVRGASRFEVCRNFAAALQLANNGNVDIARSGGDEAEPEPAQMALVLLDREPRRPDFVESAGQMLQGFGGPASPGHVSKKKKSKAAAAKKKKKKKRVAKRAAEPAASSASESEASSESSESSDSEAEAPAPQPPTPKGENLPPRNAKSKKGKRRLGPAPPKKARNGGDDDGDEDALAAAAAADAAAAAAATADDAAVAKKKRRRKRGKAEAAPVPASKSEAAPAKRSKRRRARA